MTFKRPEAARIEVLVNMTTRMLVMEIKKGKNTALGTKNTGVHMARELTR